MWELKNTLKLIIALQITIRAKTCNEAFVEGVSMSESEPITVVKCSVCNTQENILCHNNYKKLNWTDSCE